MMTNRPNSPDVGNHIEAGAGSIDPLRPGSLCPNCGEGKMDYNGLLELECPFCGHRNPDGSSST